MEFLIGLAFVTAALAMQAYEPTEDNDDVL